MNRKELMCYIRAIPLWVRKGFNKDYFCPHVFVEVKQFDESIFRNKKNNKIRIATTYSHTIDEEFIYKAHITGLQCKRCGKKDLEWTTYDNLKKIGDGNNGCGESN